MMIYDDLYVDKNKFRDEISVVSGPQQCAINNQSKETGTSHSIGLKLISNGEKLG